MQFAAAIITVLRCRMDLKTEQPLAKEPSLAQQQSGRAICLGIPMTITQ